MARQKVLRLYLSGNQLASLHLTLQAVLAEHAYCPACMYLGNDRMCIQAQALSDLLQQLK